MFVRTESWTFSFFSTAIGRYPSFFIDHLLNPRFFCVIQELNAINLDPLVLSYISETTLLLEHVLSVCVAGFPFGHMQS